MGIQRGTHSHVPSRLDRAGSVTSKAPWLEPIVSVGVVPLAPTHPGSRFLSRALRGNMTTTTLLIIVLVVLLLSGGWYGRGRWY
jgi:hypothetical protein